ncbi:unnamed protein product [Lota lota]
MVARRAVILLWACVLSVKGQGGVALTTCQSAFRVSVCPLCMNGGVCVQRDRCLCAPSFTGKFCQLPAPTQPGPAPSPGAKQVRNQPKYLLPLQSRPIGEEQKVRGSIRLRAQHPLETSVKIHQVVKVLGSGPAQQSEAGPLVPAGLRVQGQTLRGVGTYTQQSGFKYCFRQVTDKQCGSPLPGLRSKETCCRGVGRAWGITECVLCPPHAGHQGNSSCPAGFHTVNGTQCVDVNECEEPGVCEHGVCVNTRGSYSCVCRAGFILDASHGLCISQRVISEERSQCYRVLGSGTGPSSCSLPILKNITKQICCCSRVGKAWGGNCQRCPYFASVEFKDICPAGPGYHYSASALQFHQRASGSAQLVTPGNQGIQDNQSSGSAGSRVSAGSSGFDGSSGSAGSRGSAGSSGSGGSRGSAGSIGSAGSSGSAGSRGSAGSSGSDRMVSSPVIAALPLLPSKADSVPVRAAVGPNRTLGPVATIPRTAGGQNHSASRPLSPEGRGDSPRPLPPPVEPTVPPTRVQTTVHSACDRPGVCGAGRCVALAGGRHTCRCDEGYQLNSQRTHCRDVDECQLGPCSNGRCDNTPGSYKCVCHRGYQLEGNSCTDLDECEDPLRCPGQECVNNQGSYRCVSCQYGYGLFNGLCKDVDECSQSPCSNGGCENTPGSYRCVCHHGYRLQGNTCKDIDECVDLSQCPGQMCVNSVGSYHCVSCRPGYTLHNRQCIDLDECVSERVCTTDRVCVNTLGSFTCDCLPGYRSTGITMQCQDINECSEGDFCFPRGECVNTAGSYQCVCQQGYTPGNNGTVCLDEDECVSLQGVCGAARCQNVPGSFTCVCDAHGHNFNARTRECVMAQGQASLPVTSSSSSSSSHGVTPGRGRYPPIPAGGPGDLRECYYSLELSAPCRLLAANTTQQECCCTVGEGWGLGCQYLTCPTPNTAEYQSMCPSGKGYVTTGSAAFSYTDVDECKRFHPEVCKSGVCVNNIPGYTCYCSSGFIYHHTLLECVDMDECEQDDSCPGGLCVNTVGSYFCTCQPPLVLDHSQHTCINSTHLAAEEGVSLCWQQVSADLVCQSPLGRRHISFQDCCCLYGEGWGLLCALCPGTDTDDYANLCSSVLPFPGESFANPFGGEPSRRLGPGAGPGGSAGRGRGAGGGGGGGAAPPYSAPYGADSFVAGGLPDGGYRGAAGGRGYDDYLPAGGQRTPGTYGLPDGPGRRYTHIYYDDGDSHPPSFGLPPDPRSETSFGARPPPSLPEGRPLSLSPLPRGGAYVPRGGAYVPGEGSYIQEEENVEEEEAPWRPRPPFPGFTGRGGPSQRLYDRRYDSFTGLSSAEDCGILHGCENGRCIRVEEGYTCDCYHGYQLDMASMTCRDINECEGGGLESECVNARCINTDGSFRCVCWRGYIMSQRPHHCTAA